MGSVKAGYECIKAFSETDFTEDLKAIDVPVLVIHSEDDQIVPYADSAPLTVKLLKNGTLKTYKDLPHGLLPDPSRDRECRDPRLHHGLSVGHQRCIKGRPEIRPIHRRRHTRHEQSVGISQASYAVSAPLFGYKGHEHA